MILGRISAFVRFSRPQAFEIAHSEGPPRQASLLQVLHIGLRDKLF